MFLFDDVIMFSMQWGNYQRKIRKPILLMRYPWGFFIQLQNNESNTRKNAMVLGAIAHVSFYWYNCIFIAWFGDTEYLSMIYIHIWNKHGNIKMIMTWSTKCLNTKGNTLTCYWTGSPLFTQWLEITNVMLQNEFRNVVGKLTSILFRPQSLYTLSLDGCLHRFRSLQWRHSELDGVLITRIWIVCSTVCSGSDQRNIKAPRPWWPGHSPNKGTVTQKCFPLMTSSCNEPVHANQLPLLTTFFFENTQRISKSTSLIIRYLHIYCLRGVVLN